jgi:micrococcal nuclease
MAAPLLLLVFAVGITGAVALAPDPDLLPGPIPAAVVEVVDGDTLRVRAQVWLDLELETLVRLRGIDTPELRGKCEAEKAQARAAKDALARLAADGPVALTQVEYEKYAGRVLADIAGASGQDLAQAMIAAGHARAYAGGARQGWCG